MYYTIKTKIIKIKNIKDEVKEDEGIMYTML